MSNPNYIKNGGSWTNVTNLYSKSGGSWTEAEEAYKRQGGSWVKFYDKYAATTTKFNVRILEFDEESDCACTLLTDLDGETSGAYQVWDGQGMTVAVNQYVSDSAYCAKVLSLNATGNPDSYAYGGPYTGCVICANENDICAVMDDYGGGGGPGKGPGGFCLLPDMLVKHASGSLVRVEDLKIGDFIHTEDGLTQVESLIKDHPREGYYIIEDELHITNDHPVLVDGQVFRAEHYKGKKEYVEGKVNTIYVGTVGSFFSVFCGNNVYSVNGDYGKNKSK